MAPLNLPYSHRVSTGAQCRESDRKTIETFGIDGLTLMETAGLLAAQEIAKKTGSHATGLFFCGKGNNGGDALVVARYLTIQQSHTCHLYFPAGRTGLTPDAARNLELLERLKESTGRLLLHDRIESIREVRADYLTDGLLGTGLTSRLRPPYEAVIEEINQLGLPVYSMDIPSGLHTDHGVPMPTAVKATCTLSFGSLKPGYYLQQGVEYTGEVISCNLSFPDHLRGGIANLITPDLDALVPTIERAARHKYADRVVYVVAGSEGLTGAAILSAKAAWRSGAGALFLFAPRGLLPIYEGALPEVIKVPVGDREDLCFDEKHVSPVLDQLRQREGVLLIGPGLGRMESTMRFTVELLSGYEGPTVLDADAHRAIDRLPEKKLAGRILTPHSGELSTLAGKPFKNDFERIQWVAGYAKKNHLHLVSKGSPLFTAAPDGENYLTGYDTRIFARAGFGDLLAGTIAGNLAITGKTNLSIVRALIDGQRTAEHQRQITGRMPEPGDLL